MSDERLADQQVQTESANTPPTAEAAPVAEAAAEKLDALEDVDFLLEEIENKIAPLALA